MYSTKTANITNQEFNGSYMPVGINENVTLKEVNVKKSPTNLDFIEIIFENEGGQTADMTEWKNTKNQWIVTDEDLQRRDNVQFGRLIQIIDAVCGSHPEFEGNSFLEMINWVKATLDAAKANNPKLRLKVIYDNKGFTKVSNNGIFVESMSITDSQIKLFKRDLMERPVVADRENNDPLASPTSTPVTESTGADGLPF